ncbi:hypothetical protein NPIL_679892 [Nephila pilipes]|uniref:Uncharacterized protein n=2 Tax=Nephila pilipes TaxID=299642 RepID=A0A8X6Q2I4_NEPPI|nr:hypothetical protein NPIL_679892 [Nephila pilipes]
MHHRSLFAIFPSTSPGHSRPSVPLESLCTTIRYFAINQYVGSEASFNETFTSSRPRRTRAGRRKRGRIHYDTGPAQHRTTPCPRMRSPTPRLSGVLYPINSFIFRLSQHQTRTRSMEIGRRMPPLLSGRRFVSGGAANISATRSELRSTQGLPSTPSTGVWEKLVSRQAPSPGDKHIVFNDPSAGSPTETLLRLVIPLSDRVRSSFRHPFSVKERRRRSEDLTEPLNRY